MSPALRSVLPAALVVAAALSAVAPTALAGPPGQWTRISTGALDDTQEASAARTADGVLHVAWTRDMPGLADRLVDSRVRASGAAKTQVLVTPTSWKSLQSPFIVTEGDGSLRILVGGQRTGVGGADNEWLSTLTAPASGAAWTLYPTDVVTGGTSYSTHVAALRRADGVYIEAWGESGAGAHAGLHAASPEHPIGFPSCCVYDAGLAQDGATGAVWAGVTSNANGHHGVLAIPLANDASVAGAALKMPSSTLGGDVDQWLARTPITGRGAGRAGVFMAYTLGYPTPSKVGVWRVGSSSTTAVRSLASGRTSWPAIGRGAGGRLWVAWIEQESATRDAVVLRRSNPAATAWGAPVRVVLPGDEVRSLVVDGTNPTGVADVVASIDPAGAAKRGLYHTQVRPGLAVHCLAGAHAAGGRKVACTVRDAGAAVAGAKLASGAATATTGASGSATLVLAGGVRTVTAKRTGYTQAAVRVVVPA